MIVLAHRGLRSHGPENTLAGFRGVAEAAARNIPIGLEFDVRCTADHVLVTQHDDDVIFGTDRQSLVLADTWYESAERYLGEHCPPRLNDALAIVGPGVPLIDIDIKERGYTEAVVDACRHVDPERLSLSSHIPQVIVEARAAAPRGVRIGMSVSEHFHFGDDALIDLVHQVDADFLFLEHDHITAALVDRLHDAKKEVGAYTVNEHQRLHDLIEMGVDYPCTDAPEMAISELTRQAPPT